MSFETYRKLKLDKLNTTSILHVVGTSGESLGARGRTRCEVNINGRSFFQTFIVCKHLKMSNDFRQRFLNTKLHRNLLDKDKHMPINTKL